MRKMVSRYNTVTNSYEIGYYSGQRFIIVSIVKEQGRKANV